MLLKNEVGDVDGLRQVALDLLYFLVDFHELLHGVLFVTVEAPSHQGHIHEALHSLQLRDKKVEFLLLIT